MEPVALSQNSDDPFQLKNAPQKKGVFNFNRNITPLKDLGGQVKKYQKPILYGVAGATVAAVAKTIQSIMSTEIVPNPPMVDIIDNQISLIEGLVSCFVLFSFLRFGFWELQSRINPIKIKTRAEIQGEIDEKYKEALVLINQSQKNLSNASLLQNDENILNIIRFLFEKQKFEKVEEIGRLWIKNGKQLPESVKEFIRLLFYFDSSEICSTINHFKESQSFKKFQNFFFMKLARQIETAVDVKDCYMVRESRRDRIIKLLSPFFEENFLFYREVIDFSPNCAWRFATFCLESDFSGDHPAQRIIEGAKNSLFRQENEYAARFTIRFIQKQFNIKSHILEFDPQLKDLYNWLCQSDFNLDEIIKSFREFKEKPYQIADEMLKQALVTHKREEELLRPSCSSQNEDEKDVLCPSAEEEELESARDQEPKKFLEIGL